MLREKRPGVEGRMDGVRVVTVDDASILVLEEVTQEIKDTLNTRLVEYCYGRVKTAEDPDYYSLDTTLDEFFKLYDTKSETTQLGIAGELIVHLLVPHGHEQLVSAALYLNKEERAIKKGFDLTFYDEHDGGLWYGEVKAGKVSVTQTADSKVRDLIGVAERSLHDMFTSDVRKKRWDAALLDADATLQSAQASSVKKLLRTDFKTVNGGGTAKVRALLCGVVMRDLMLDEIDPETGKALIESVKRRERFADLRLLLIQQSDLEDLIEVLRASIGAPI
ncbi:hypothetical protein GCM10027417_03290 [Glutamicibacter endophyticus]